MARVSRTFIDYGCYHVTARGNRKQEVFNDDFDRNKYLEILKKSKKKYEIMLYAYCLMPNHIHLLIEVEDARNMSKFMHWISRGYTAYFNVKYEKVGHLWQGRFRSRPILKGQYLINCATYIEVNPIRANMISEISQYKWSSYQERCFLSKKIFLDEIHIEQTESRLGTALSSDLGTL